MPFPALTSRRPTKTCIYYITLILYSRWTLSTAGPGTSAVASAATPPRAAKTAAAKTAKAGKTLTRRAAASSEGSSATAKAAWATCTTRVAAAAVAAEEDWAGTGRGAAGQKFGTFRARPPPTTTFAQCVFVCLQGHLLPGWPRLNHPPLASHEHARALLLCLLLCFSRLFWFARAGLGCKILF